MKAQNNKKLHEMVIIIVYGPRKSGGIISLINWS